MKPIDFIVSWVKTEATEAEKQRVAIALNKYEAPPLKVEDVIARLRDTCTQRFANTGEKLNAVKYDKDVTGWGLKESKDWVDVNIEFKRQNF